MHLENMFIPLAYTFNTILFFANFKLFSPLRITWGWKNTYKYCEIYPLSLVSMSENRLAFTTWYIKK
jgi:hypothetical protein